MPAELKARLRNKSDHEHVVQDRGHITRRCRKHHLHVVCLARLSTRQSVDSTALPDLYLDPDYLCAQPTAESLRSSLVSPFSPPRLSSRPLSVLFPPCCACCRRCVCSPPSSCHGSADGMLPDVLFSRPCDFSERTGTVPVLHLSIPAPFNINVIPGFCASI